MWYEPILIWECGSCSCQNSGNFGVHGALTGESITVWGYVSKHTCQCGKPVGPQGHRNYQVCFQIQEDELELITELTSHWFLLGPCGPMSNFSILLHTWFQWSYVIFGSYLMAIAELSLKKTELEETRSKAQRESKMLLDYTRKAIARLTYLKR